MKNVINYLEQGPDALKGKRAIAKRNIKKRALRFLIINGKLYRLEQNDSFAEIVNDERVKSVLTWAHETYSYFVYIITMNNLKGRFWWPIRSRDTQKKVIKCPICQRCGPRSFRLRYGKITILAPWVMVGMDFTGPIKPSAANRS